MKKSYENYKKIILCISVFFIFIGIFIFSLNRKGIIIYEKFSGIYFKENTLVLVLNDEEINLFLKNKKLFINNKKRSFEIEKIDKDILERNGDNYSQVYIKTDISTMYKINDVIEISVMDKKIKLFNIFRIIWEGD